MNGELDRVWQEVVVAFFKVFYDMLLVIYAQCPRNWCEHVTFCIY